MVVVGEQQEEREGQEEVLELEQVEVEQQVVLVEVVQYF
jgi:hypothetical protein